MTNRGRLHHVELWVPDLDRADASWGWLLGELGYVRDRSWDAGVSWRLGPTALILESGPDLTPGEHDRRRAGLNHLALHAGGRSEVDRLVVAAPSHGWSLLFPDRHPWAGGTAHYAGYLADRDGFEVELVADV